MDNRIRHEKFEALYTANAQDVLSFALRRASNSHEATEMLAEAMLVAWRRIDEVPNGVEARLWLFGVARNVINNSRRSSRRQKRLIEKIAGHIEISVEDEISFSDPLVARVSTALYELRPIEAEVIRLSFWEELTPAQISELLQIPSATVRTHLHRGYLKLRDILGHIEVSDLQVGKKAGEENE